MNCQNTLTVLTLWKMLVNCQNTLTVLTQAKDVHKLSEYTDSAHLGRGC